MSGLGNLMKLAEALYPLVGEAESLQEGLDFYKQKFQEHYTALRYEKLGLSLPTSPAKNAVVNRLYDIMEHTETDFTILFRILSGLTVNDLTLQDDIEQHTSLLRSAFYQYDTWEESMHQRWSDWLVSYRDVLIEDGISEPDRLDKMKAVNPKFIFRNYLAQLRSLMTSSL